MSLFESFLKLTPDLISKICSFTDDNTIYNLSISSKALSCIMNTSKDLIPILRLDEPLYNNYPLFLKDQKYQPTASISETQLYVQQETLVEDIHTFQTSHESSSCIILTAESQQEHNNQLSHLITSIRIKGCVTAIHLSFATTTILTRDFPINSLLPDEQGYVEILNPFAPFLPLFCVSQFETLLHLQTKGLVTVKVKKCRSPIHYIQMLLWNKQTCQLRVIKTDTILTSMTKAINGQTKICIPIQYNRPDNTSIGLYINIKNSQGEYINKKYIRAFMITWTNPFEQGNLEQFILSARSIHISAITHTEHYNLNTTTLFKHGFYIPLSRLERPISQFQQPQHIHLKLILKKPITTLPFNTEITYMYNDILTFNMKNEELHNEI